MYYSVAHPSTGKSPAEILFGREYGTKMPSVLSEARFDDGEIRDKDLSAKLRRKFYRDNRLHASQNVVKEGDVVVLKNMQKKNKLALTFSPERFIVTEKVGDVITVRSEANGRLYRRSLNHAKVIPVPDLVPDVVGEQHTDTGDVIDNSSGGRAIVVGLDPGGSHDGVGIDVPRPALQNKGEQTIGVARRSGRSRQAPSHLNDFILE